VENASFPTLGDPKLYHINPLTPCSIKSAAFIVDKAAPKE